MADVQDYIGKKVDLVLNDDGEQVDLTGKIESANSLGFVFKPFGSPKVALYEVGQIVNLALAAEKEAPLKPRRINPVDMGNVKRHLVDRHGYPLADIDTMSADDALDFHETQVQHASLSHFHADAKPKADTGSVPPEQVEDDEDDEPDF